MKRNGSALLIVLGVLSFLVVSAVAFSAFMRRSRLPSSYLRRSVASRQLAKAAVAAAIDEIDRAIADDVHPGVGSRPKNKWRDRVFFRGDEEESLRRSAPVLTLEGLAYIPPPLVNELRYWARKTPTAAWQPFGFDVGRYAYVALDVSDYFDVNRLVADYPRSSAANRRVTISHMLEKSGHKNAPSAADIRAWDRFMDDFRTIDEDTLDIDFESKIPLVSIADFNLALAKKGSVGGMKSPFKDYLDKGMFYSADSESDLERYAAMTFVTDGWFPKPLETTAGGSDGANTVRQYDLADAKSQPYAMSKLGRSDTVLISEATAFYKQIAPSTEAMIWYQRLSGLGMAALADYLDADNVPISLAVPTTERVPMICGIEPKLGSQSAFAVKTDPGKLSTLDESTETQRQVEQTVRLKVDGEKLGAGFMGGQVRALVAYPFLHPDDSDNSEWTLDGKFAMFLTSGRTMPFRTGNESDVLHFDKSSLPDSMVNSDTGVMTIKLEGGRPTFPKKIAKQEDAVKLVTLRLDGGVAQANRLDSDGNELLSVTYQWTQNRKKSGDSFTEWEPTFEMVKGDPVKWGAKIKAHSALPALYGDGNKIGSPDEDFTDEKLSQTLTGNPNWTKTLHLNMAVWLRVKNKDGKVVDMVPASLSDDAIQNSVHDEMIGVVQRGGSMQIDGSSWPVLRFDPQVSFNFGIDMSELEGAGKPIDIKQKALMVPDPRHNHAPETWFAVASGGIAEETWLNNNLFKDRDGDIFMATSDAGYLQSKYELAFLPRFTNLRTSGNSKFSGNYGVPPNNWHDDEYGASAANVWGQEFMWNTYDPFDDEDAAAFEDLPFTSEGTGMKVNPYSHSTNVLMAAFANTPLDWRHSSTNDSNGFLAPAITEDVVTFNGKFAWNAYSSGGTFDWIDLKQVAGAFMEEVKKAGNDGWKKAWRNLDWDDPEEGGFLGMDFEGQTENLRSVDRKFFYGFWRDCFAARQQLFLVFVRAEPLMLGGGTADQMPPQLGARAVALVWRDPETSAKSVNGYPHRTRLLFYRPLE